MGRLDKRHGRTALQIDARFYDPLYEVVVMRPRPSGGRAYLEALITGVSTPGDVVPVLKTYDMNRLNFLRQAGLAWLVYPSATHTRFSHSLGCWMLGERALRSVWVQGKDKAGTLERLSDWVTRKGLAEEFMLSLLLHDLGHFPFSHVLENNPYFADVNHEEVTTQLIKGKGEQFEAFKRHVEGRQNGQASDFVASVLEKRADVDKEVVCALIAGDMSHISRERGSWSHSDIAALMQLVSGTIDLDRLDHYRRDSYFMGVSVGNFNIEGLLNDMIIAEGRDGNSGKIILVDDGVLHAFNLLFSKDQLVANVFHSTENIAYEAMLNRGISTYLEAAGGQDRVNEIRCWTDDELLYKLEASGLESIRQILFRIRNRIPYFLLGKFVVGNNAYLNMEALRRLHAELTNRLAQKKRGSPSSLLFRVGKGFGKGGQRIAKQWLDLDAIENSSGRSLRNDPEHREFVGYLDRVEEVQTRQIWIFAETSEIASTSWLERDIRRELGAD